MSGGTLFAGPYIGEFGHEVMGTGLLRAHARHFDRVIVCSRPAREALYDDIATEFRPHDIQCVGVGSRATEETQPSKALLDSLIEPGCTEWPNYFAPPNCGAPATEAKIVHCHGHYHRLGTPRDEWKGVVAFHVRNRPHEANRNWPMEHWVGLATALHAKAAVRKIVCVGTKGEALCVEGCVDMRDSPLRTQMDIAASAICAVGPSSGWMHLASLCDCPHLTWVGEPEHVYVKRRYFRKWNPLRTPVHVMPAQTWQPEYEPVLRCLASMVEAAT